MSCQAAREHPFEDGCRCAAPCMPDLGEYCCFFSTPRQGVQFFGCRPRRGKYGSIWPLFPACARELGHECRRSSAADLKKSQAMGPSAMAPFPACAGDRRQGQRGPPLRRPPPSIHPHSRGQSPKRRDPGCPGWLQHQKGWPAYDRAGFRPFLQSVAGVIDYVLNGRQLNMVFPQHPVHRVQVLLVFRQPQYQELLKQGSLPLPLLASLASELRQHCGFCKQWMRTGSVKEHIKRTHPSVWDAGLGSFESLCKDYKVHVETDSACVICSAKVYQTDRRAKSCLAQVALAAAWARAGMPEEPRLILEGGHDEEHCQKLLRHLARHCGLCDASTNKTGDDACFKVTLRSGIRIRTNWKKSCNASRPADPVLSTE